MANINYSLDRLRKVFDKLEISFPKSKIIQITGTNGKGTVANFLYYLLKQNKHTVALYTSPHLVSVRERIIFNDKKIPQKLLNENITRFQKENLTYFEALTLTALLWFYKQQPEFIILEVGLGGRLDATNIVDADIAVLTSVALDHQDILGDTVEKIAKDKLGILKKNKILVSGEENLEKLISDNVNQKQAKLYQYNKDFSYKFNNIKSKVEILTKLKYQTLVNFKTAVQIKNLSIAFMVASLLIDIKKYDFSKYYLKGRLEKFVDQKKNTFYFDTAHNVSAIESIREYFITNSIKPTIFLSIMKDKDLLGILDILKEFKVILVPSHRFSDRGFTYKELLSYKLYNLKNFTEVFNYIKSLKATEETFAFLGSHYTYNCIARHLKRIGAKQCI